MSPRNNLSFYQLFKYATKFDYVLMTLGTLAALINGAAVPVFSLILGSMTDEFGIIIHFTYNKIKDQLHKVMHLLPLPGNSLNTISILDASVLLLLSYNSIAGCRRDLGKLLNLDNTTSNHYSIKIFLFMTHNKIHKKLLL